MHSNESKTFDTLKWLVAASLLGIGVFANYYYGEINVAYRIVAWLFLGAVILFVALQTTKGKLFLAFAHEAKVEMQKVIWPSRQETLQMTVIVMVIVTLMALLLWGIDSFFFWLVGLLR